MAGSLPVTGRKWVLPFRTSGVALLRLLFVFMVAALLAIVCASAYVMIDARRNVTQDVATAASNIASAVAHDVDRNFELLDLSIRSAATAWSQPSVRSLAPALRDLILFDASTSGRGLGYMLVLDATGVVRACSRSCDYTGKSFADRDYFRVHVANADVGLFVSKPFTSRLTGVWQVGLSRRITDLEGRFAGVVVGTLQLDYLHDLYESQKLGADSSITLFRTDGTVVTREPYAVSDIGMTLRHSEGFSRIRDARIGSIEGPSPFDGKNRIMSYHRVGNLPLIQDVEISTDRAYAEWWQKASIIGAILAFLCASSLSLLFMLRAELTRRVAVEAALAHLATTDALTNLANRRRLDEAIDTEWRRAIREGSALTLVMIDADNFKAYNDYYGHPAGDTLLKAFARCIESSISRPGDLAARYGGEEFAVLLPATGMDGGYTIAETIRTAVTGLAQPHPPSPLGVATVSIGVASIVPVFGQASILLLTAADAALYRAKADGKNRVRVEHIGAAGRRDAA